MTQQLSKSSKVSSFVYLALSAAQIAPAPLVAPPSARADRVQKQGHRSSEVLAILPRSGKFLAKARGKRHFKRQKEQGRRNKAEGRNANFLPLHPSIGSSSTQAVAFSIEPSFKNRQGLYNSRSARRC